MLSESGSPNPQPVGLLDPEDKDVMLIQNIGNYFPLHVVTC